MARSILSRSAMEALLVHQAELMSADTTLGRDAVDLLVRAAEYYWIHQTSWFGEPVLNPAQDMFARQEIIFRTRPDYIIELGVAWGGSLLFYATLMDALGGKKIVGVDTFIPASLKRRLQRHGRLSGRLELIRGSSTAPETIKAVRKVIGRSRKVLVVLDSNHTHDHVLEELRTYGNLVGKGHYMICDDTFVQDIRGPSRLTADRPWGPGDNPRTALEAFLSEDSRFEPDARLRNKLLISCNPDGYLRRVR